MRRNGLIGDAVQFVCTGQHPLQIGAPPQQQQVQEGHKNPPTNSERMKGLAARLVGNMPSTSEKHKGHCARAGEKTPGPVLAAGCSGTPRDWPSPASPHSGSCARSNKEPAAPQPPPGPEGAASRDQESQRRAATPFDRYASDLLSGFHATTPSPPHFSKRVRMPR
jgi:hypothetical protein